jgi:UDPglucose 6-dehydrogenase
MSVESAEMVKHALNSYLAVSVVVANEIARISELVGADASEVEAGLRSDMRIGPKAYVRPGPAFAGGTLARDINFLSGLARENEVAVPVIDSVLPSNRIQHQWLLSCLRRHFGVLKDRTVAVLGLAYKPGTSTLRRSAAIDLVRALLQEGASVRAFDPHVRALPADLAASVTLVADARSAARGADALVVSTECEEFRKLSVADLAGEMAGRLVLDPGRFLAPEFARDPRLSLISVGRAT